jgi:WD40 repeat protein
LLVVLALTLPCAPAANSADNQQLPFDIGSPDAVYSVSFHPDGKLVASCGSEGDGIRLWDTVTGKCVTTLKEQGKPVSCVAFSPDGKWLAAGERSKVVRIWDVKTQRPLTRFEDLPHNPVALVFDKAGRIMAVSCWSVEGVAIQLWDLQTKRSTAILRGHTDFTVALAFSPDGKTLASGSYDNSLTLWDVSTGKVERMLKHPPGVMAVAFSPDGKQLMSGDGVDTISLWDMKTWKVQEVKIKPGSLGLESMAFSPDGTLCVTGESGFTKGIEEKEAIIAVWNTMTGEEVSRLEGHKTKVLTLAFSPDGTKVASGGWDTKVRIGRIPRPK